MLSKNLIRTIGFAGLLCLSALTLVLAHRAFEARALDELFDREKPIVALHTENVSGWLGRYRPLAPTYAHYSEVIGFLRYPDDPIRLDAINLQLERWTAASGASDTYLLDSNGLTIAASNWNNPQPFVGNDYGFRPYFQDAMQGRLGRYFALGTTTGIRGYFFAYPVQDDGPPIGVVVVKIQVGLIEQDLRASPHQIFVSDADGVILLSGHPRWRLKTIGALDSETKRRIGKMRQFAGAPLEPVEVDGLAQGGLNNRHLVYAVPDRSNAEKTEFLHLTQTMPVEGWTLHLLVDTREAREQALVYTLVLGLGLLASILIGYVFWQRRQFYLSRLAKREQIQRVLERRVEKRTVDLRTTNARLAEEVAERTQAEATLRQTQTELVQAGKLAALGQMSTALSHEFNQPLAAIRTYADNAAAFIERGQVEKADANLGRISRLTERMAQLSKHLTAFARKPKDTKEPTSLAATLSEAIELLRARIETAGATVNVECDDALTVIGGQTRLQHVFMNLIGNALDATAEKPAARISIKAAENDGLAVVTVEDNGTGFAPDDIDKLFDPFFSRKEPGKGLGLGLSISFNIIRDFGGTISARNMRDGGAQFTVTLSLADAQMEAAE